MSVWLERGVRLWRVHSRRLRSGKQLGGWELNPTRPATAFDGGRFDPIEEGGPAHLYLGESADCAVAEALLRVLPANDRAPRQLPRRILEGVNLTELELKEPQRLVSMLGGRALAQLGQDSWLTKSDPKDYPYTREWGRAIRTWCPWGNGFVWHSRLDEELRAYVLFHGAAEARMLEVRATQPLDEEEGMGRLRTILSTYNTTIE